MPRRKPRLLREPLVRSTLMQDVLARAGGDLLIKDDVSLRGLHRRHIIRYGGLPDVEGWRKTVPSFAKWWAYMDDDGKVGHLWMAWKER